MEDSRGVEEEEQEHADDAKQDDDDRQANEYGGSSERRSQYGLKVIELSTTDQILAILNKSTVLPQAKVTDTMAFCRSSEPLWLNKDNNVDNSKTNSEYTP